ncbi:hypothetical protein AAFF_G00289070 [Aldrovandia affinis]|uniref:Uncharacterized protein n=1 Tax=Aldrovandia affinis TaxID=143900 RepID=A0AAD7RAB5_9TELE|nr:hypothetical protein AAFF_G00289070 [Aldrovandia affinis]
MSRVESGMGPPSLPAQHQVDPRHSSAPKNPAGAAPPYDGDTPQGPPAQNRKWGRLGHSVARETTSTNGEGGEGRALVSEIDLDNEVLNIFVLLGSGPSPPAPSTGLRAPCALVFRVRPRPAQRAVGSGARAPPPPSGDVYWVRNPCAEAALPHSHLSGDLEAVEMRRTPLLLNLVGVSQALLGGILISVGGAAQPPVSGAACSPCLRGLLQLLQDLRGVKRCSDGSGYAR